VISRSDQPFVIDGSGKYDPAQPITTSGNNPNNSTEYDYWDHLEYIIDLAASKGIYVDLLPCWGDSRVVDESNDPSATRIFNMANAYTYGHWIGDRFKDKTNIIWIMGGDTNPEGYTNTFRKMAEGVADGVNGVNNNDGNADYSTTLMSYHASRWSKSSSYYFPNDAFMDFNSDQAVPETQVHRIQTDYALTPVKPTWILEGLYENRVETPGTYGAWQCRFQAYQTVFAGGFGHTYGNMSIWDFDPDWTSKINDPGGKDMQHLCSLMNSLDKTQFLTRIPDQDLLDGDTGGFSELHGYKSSCIVATRTTSGDLAMVYCANGKNIKVKMSRLSGPSKRARWLNPRDGSYALISTNVTSGSGASIHTFNPTGSESDGNDWVLVLDSLGSEPEPIYPDPSTLHVSSNGRYLITEDDGAFFPQNDWGTSLPWHLSTADAETYIDTRKNQGFNMITVQAVDDCGDSDAYSYSTNIYGILPFATQSSGDYNGRWDITKPKESYWSAIDSVIDYAATLGMYVAFIPLPTDNLLLNYRCMPRGDDATCYAFGNWIGKRYAAKSNIVWITGLGQAANPWHTAQSQVSALAKGIADGVNGVSNNVGTTDYSTTLMSYFPWRWDHNSAYWFGNESWLDFNCIAEVPGSHTPEGDYYQLPELTNDYALTPVKPIWLMGPMFEKQRQASIFTAAQSRFQAWQSVLAGGFGVSYGHRYVQAFDSGWSSYLNTDGAYEMQYITALISPIIASLVPDQSLLVGDTGSVTKGAGNDYYYAQSTLIQAARTANTSTTVVYSAYGNDITVKMSELNYGNVMKAEWFNPRTGVKTLISNSIQSGSGAPDHTFDTPGSPAQDNDQVLVLTTGIPEPTFLIGGLFIVIAFLRNKHIYIFI